jgi:uncharacterized membrane protein
MNQPQTEQIIETFHYQGILPPPNVLREFEATLEGTANRLLTLVEQEAHIRREIDMQVMQANIAAQQRQLDLAETQSKAVFKNDFLGQIAGFIICVICVGAAVYLGINNHDALAGGALAVPSASLIRTFFMKRN